MKKLFIKNRKNKKISVLVERADNPKGLAFVMHGSGGFKEREPMKTFARFFKDNNYNVVRFDATNTFGESDGVFDDLTFDSFYEDLLDVVEWSKKQDFYTEPFTINGYSLSGMCSLYFAEKYPDLVESLVLISTVVDGHKLIEKYSKEELLDWKKKGAKTWMSKHGYQKNLKYSYIESMMKPDILGHIDKIKAPVLLICGDLDDTTPLKHQKILFDALSSRKELKVLKGLGHSFDSYSSDAIYNILDNWIKKIN